MIVQNLVKYSAKRTSTPTADVVETAEDTNTTNIVVAAGVDHSASLPTSEVIVGGATKGSGPHAPPAEEDCS